jgi:hypothetical protein
MAAAIDMLAICVGQREDGWMLGWQLHGLECSGSGQPISTIAVTVSATDRSFRNPRARGTNDRS